MVSAPNAVALDDPECFEAFFATDLPRVYSYLLARCGGDRAVAEDLTQETFLADVREIKRGRAVAMPLPWVIGIARHKLFDFYRASAKDNPVTAIWDDDLVAALPASPELSAPERDRVQRALMRVPPVQRQALVLRYMDGCSVPNVAQELGRSLHAAESLLARGRVSFRRAYRQEDERDG